MAEYDNDNLNIEGNNNINNNSSADNKFPEYSFWAENVPRASQANDSKPNESYQNNVNHNYYTSSNDNTNTSHNPNVNYNMNSNYNSNANYNPNSIHNSNANYNLNTSYNPNASHNPNASYNPNASHNPNAGYNPNARHNPNAGYNPNTSYNSNSWSYGNNQSNIPNSKPRRERKPMNKVVKFMLKAVCFGLLSVLSFVGFGQLYYVLNPDAASSKLIRNLNQEELSQTKYEIGYTSGGDVKREDKSAISKIVKQTMPSIVSINSTVTQTTNWFGQPYSEEVEGSGSGFIVGMNDKELLIATNNHVVEGTDKIKVTFIDGSQADAIIKGTDAKADLAVVCVDIASLEKSTLEAIEVAKLGNSEKVEVGQMSIAIGNALGYGQSVTVGYISAKDREVEISDGYTSNNMILLQTDAAINPGNSGGALLNITGDVIGINTVKYASNEVEGMGYAIPISRAIPIINELMSREILAEEDQGYLGIVGNDVTEDVASYYNMPVGVFLNELAKEGAAEKAGLLPGDIIIKADEIEITSITQLRDYVTSKRIGTEVKITYMRKSSSEYKESTLTVRLAKNPNITNPEE